MEFCVVKFVGSDMYTRTHVCTYMCTYWLKPTFSFVLCTGYVSSKTGHSHYLRGNGLTTVWTGHRVDRTPCGPATAWTEHRVDRPPRGLNTAWTEHRVDRPPCGPNTLMIFCNLKKALQIHSIVSIALNPYPSMCSFVNFNCCNYYTVSIL